MNLRYAKRSEATEQARVVQWCAFEESRHPELRWIHHCPNGGSRNRLEAINLKQQGVKAGVPDLHLPVPKGIYCGLYIEMKFGKNKHEESQLEWLDGMEAAGHFVCTCYNADQAIKVIKAYVELADFVMKNIGTDLLVSCTAENCSPNETMTFKGKRMFMNLENNIVLK